MSKSVSEASWDKFDTNASVQQFFSAAETRDNYEMVKWALENVSDVNKVANYEYISDEKNLLIVNIFNFNIWADGYVSDKNIL